MPQAGPSTSSDRSRPCQVVVSRLFEHIYYQTSHESPRPRPSTVLVQPCRKHQVSCHPCPPVMQHQSEYLTRDQYGWHCKVALAAVLHSHIHLVGSKIVQRLSGLDRARTLCVAVETSPNVGLGFVLEASSHKIFRADVLPSGDVIRWREGHLDGGADQKLVCGGGLVPPCPGRSASVEVAVLSSAASI